MPHPFFQSPQDLPDEKSKHRQACEKVSQEALSGALAQMPSNDLAPTLKLESKQGIVKAPVSAAESFSSSWFGGENSSASSAFDNIGVAPHHQAIASQPSSLPFETAQGRPPQLPGGFFPQQTLHDFFLPPAEETAREVKPVALNIAAYSSEVLSEGGEANYIGDETFEQLSTASASFSNVGDLSMTFGNSCLRCRKLNDPSSAFCNRCGLQLTHGIGYTPPVDPSSLTLHDHPIHPSVEPASGTPQASYPVQHQSHTMPVVPTGASPQDPTSQMVTEQRPLMSSGPLVSFALPTQPISRPAHAMSSMPYASQQFQHPSWPRTELQDQEKYTPLLEVPEASIPATISSPELPQKRRAHPIFCFGFGGQVLVSFPLKQMRYAIHQPIGTGSAHFRPGLFYRCNVKDLPSIKARLIDPVLDSYNGLPIEEKYVKVKDVVKTLEDMISRSSASPKVNPTQTVLLTLLALILKQRGGLKAIPEETLSRLLLPEETSTVQDFGMMASNPSGPSPGVVAEVTKSLSKGNRSDAVSVAVSHRMWDVALMIASHVDRETYCATVNEFARRSFPIAHPLRTLFLLFAGQGALAGMEMQQLGPSVKSFWKSILSTIVANRTVDDSVAISALGDALLKEGEVFAAHVCYILCNDPSLFSSPTDSNGRIVYLGKNHKLYPSSFYRDWSSLRLTEILEYTLKHASGGVRATSNLLPYKYIFANWLADLGLTDLALKYCDILQESSLSFEYVEAVKSLRERVTRCLGLPLSRSGVSDGGWLPKMGGLLERVIGVSTEAEDVVTEALVDPSGHRWSVQAEASFQAQHAFPPAMPMFVPAAPSPQGSSQPHMSSFHYPAPLSDAGSDANFHGQRYQAPITSPSASLGADHTIPNDSHVNPNMIPRPQQLPLAPSMSAAFSGPMQSPQPPQGFTGHQGSLTQASQQLSFQPENIQASNEHTHAVQDRIFSISSSGESHELSQIIGNHPSVPQTSQGQWQPPSIPVTQPTYYVQQSHYAAGEVQPPYPFSQANPSANPTMSMQQPHYGPARGQSQSQGQYSIPLTSNHPSQEQSRSGASSVSRGHQGFVPMSPFQSNQSQNPYAAPHQNLSSLPGPVGSTPFTNATIAPATQSQLPSEPSMSSHHHQISSSSAPHQNFAGPQAGNLYQGSISKPGPDPSGPQSVADLQQAGNDPLVNLYPAQGFSNAVSPFAMAPPTLPLNSPETPGFSNAPSQRVEPELSKVPSQAHAAMKHLGSPALPFSTPGAPPPSSQDPMALHAPSMAMPPPNPTGFPMASAIATSQSTIFVPHQSPSQHPLPAGDNMPSTPPSRVGNGEEDDFGFGNTSLSRNKLPGDQQASTNDQEDSKGITGLYIFLKDRIGDASDGKIQEKKGVLGFITGLFGKKAMSGDQVAVSPAKQANLGEPSTFRYDETLKRWVDSKDPQSTQTAAAPPAPPAVNLNSMPSLLAPVDGSPANFRRGATRSARSKYVDPLNPDASGDVDAAAPTLQIPTAASVGTNPVPMMPTAPGMHHQNPGQQEPPGIPTDYHPFSQPQPQAQQAALPAQRLSSSQFYQPPHYDSHGASPDPNTVPGYHHQQWNPPQSSFVDHKRVADGPISLVAGATVPENKEGWPFPSNPAGRLECLRSEGEHTVISHDKESRASVQRPPTPIPRIQDIQTLPDPFHPPSGHFYHPIAQNGRSEGIDDLSEQLQGIHLNKRGQTDLARIVDETLISASWNSGSPKIGERESSPASF